MLLDDALKGFEQGGQSSAKNRTLFGLATALMSDVDRADALREKDNDGYSRRQYIRTVFTLLEGSIFEMKAWVLENRTNQLTAAEVAILSETTYDLSEKGELFPRPSHLKLAANLLFTLPIFARVNGGGITIDKGGTDWVAFQTSLKVRHRLTHPKSVDDLEVTDAEISSADKTVLWFALLVSDALTIMLTRELFDFMPTKPPAHMTFDEMVGNVRDAIRETFLNQSKRVV